jgi:hypothetical protein
MRAIKLQAQIGRDHMLHLQLPEDLNEGPAEVIVLIPEEKTAAQTTAGESAGLAKFLEKNRLDRRWVKSKEELDRYLADERDSWE